MATISIRSQIMNLLKDDATIISLLGSANAVINERDYTANSATPGVVVHYLGPHSHQNVPELDEEEWEIACFDTGQAYYNIEEILVQCRRVLHKAILTANTNGVSAGLEIRFHSHTKARYDPVFRHESESMTFLVPVLYTS